MKPDNSDLATTKYGRRKLDPAAYTKQQGEKKRTVGNVRYGRRKVDGPKVAPDASAGGSEAPTGQGAARNPFLVDPVPADVNHSGKVSVKEMLALLRGNPELLDQAISAEFVRGRPRPTAIIQLKQFEQKRNGMPRADVLRLLNAALESEQNQGGEQDQPNPSATDATGPGAEGEGTAAQAAPGTVDPGSTGSPA